jgi:4'-phosphopantetheinyl transferase
MVDLSYIDLTLPDGLREPLLGRAWDLLDAYERERAERLRFDSHRERYVLGHACVRILLANYCTAAAQSLRIARHCNHCGHPTHGKPTLAEFGHVEFSLSHSAEWLMLGITTGHALGVDLEKSERDRTPAIASTFSAAEQAHFETLPALERSAHAFVVWSQKEAFLKRLGLGLARDPRSVDTLAPELRDTTQSLPAPAGYTAAISIAGGVGELTPQYFTAPMVLGGK